MSDIILSMHPTSRNAWRAFDYLTQNQESDEHYIDTPPENWHMLVPPDAGTWTWVANNLQAQLEKLDNIQGNIIHVFAQSPYSLGALLGNRLFSKFAGAYATNVHIYQFDRSCMAWSDWGPAPSINSTEREPAELFDKPFFSVVPALDEPSDSHCSKNIQHIFLAIGITQLPSSSEIENVSLLLGGNKLLLNVKASELGTSAIRSRSGVNRAAAELDELPFKVCDRYPLAHIHLFYVGPLALLMRAATRWHKLGTSLTVYERIKTEGLLRFVPALEFPNGKLLLGPQPRENLGHLAANGADPSPIHLPQRLPATLQILSLASEWFSKKGGLSTFNRDLCIALAHEGHKVFCYVPEPSRDEKDDARKKNVELVGPTVSGPEGLNRLYHEPDYSILRPHVIIGHGRITGKQARHQSQKIYPGTFRIQFIHTAPDEIEPFKNDSDADLIAKKSEERAEQELDLAHDADLVVGVGSELTKWIRKELNAACYTATVVHRFDPGLPDIAAAPPPDDPSCLLLCRAEDARLKGLDIAAKALESLPRNRGITPKLRIRGVPDGEANVLRDYLKRVAPKLLPSLLHYTLDREAIARDIRKSAVVLMPSRSEGFGLSALEAIAAGVPVRVSAQSGLGRALLDLGTEAAKRAVVETDEADDEKAIKSWEEALYDVLRSREFAFEQAKRLRDDVQQLFNWKSAVTKLVEAINQVHNARQA